MIVRDASSSPLHTPLYALLPPSRSQDICTILSPFPSHLSVCAHAGTGSTIGITTVTAEAKGLPRRVPDIAITKSFRAVDILDGVYVHLGGVFDN